MKRLFTAALTVAALTASAPTFADVPPPAADAARSRDASIDRGFLTSHAETIGEDRWSINSYELVLLGVTYGVTNDFQLSLMTTLPVVEGMPLYLAFNGKFVFYRDDSTVAAVRGQFVYATELDDGGDDAIGLFGAAVLVDHYLDAAGRFSLHAGVSVNGAFGVGLATGGVDVAEGAFITFELGASFGLTSGFKLQVETLIPALSTASDFEFAPFALVNYGFRFHGGELAADLGFMKPVGDTDDTFLLGFPFVAFSARF